MKLHSVSLLRRLLAKIGFEEYVPFAWKQKELKIEVNLVERCPDKKLEEVQKWLGANKRNNSHKIREAYRCWQWNFLMKESKRHDIAEIRTKRFDKTYSTKRARRAKELAVDGVAMTILAGSFRSPGTFAHTQNQNHFPTKCIACDATGYHDHLFWHCTHVEAKFKETFGDRPKAKDPL